VSFNSQAFSYDPESGIVSIAFNHDVGKQIEANSDKIFEAMKSKSPVQQVAQQMALNKSNEVGVSAPVKEAVTEAFKENSAAEIDQKLRATAKEYHENKENIAINSSIANKGIHANEVTKGNNGIG